MSELFHLLRIDPHVIAAQILGFALLWILLRRYLFGPVMGLVQSRQQEIKSTYEAAENEQAKAEEFRTEYEKRLTGIEAEARAKIQEAIKHADDAKNEIVADARRRSEDILKRGEEELAHEREKTLAAIREEVVDLSLEAAGKLVGETLDEPRHRRLIGDFISRLAK
ncbi:MAG TPA: F0F1 ATP synthase subunit B [Armatimonadota bacterium]|nr:F0F1 ATP synthase subunit B [Armatimonadota bacterium]